MCLREMTSGNTVQSRMNCMHSMVFSVVVYFLMMGRRKGLSLRKAAQREKTLCLAGARSTHSVRIWGRVPGVWFCLHTGRLQKPVETPDQCLDSQHVRKRPDSILAWQQAFSTS